MRGLILCVNWFIEGSLVKQGFKTLDGPETSLFWALLYKPFLLAYSLGSATSKEVSKNDFEMLFMVHCRIL